MKMSRATKLAMAMFLFCFPCGAYANPANSYHKHLDAEMQNTPMNNLLSDIRDNGNQFNAEKHSIAVKVTKLKAIVWEKLNLAKARNELEKFATYVKEATDSESAEVKQRVPAGSSSFKAASAKIMVKNKDTPDINNFTVKIGDKESDKRYTEGKDKKREILETQFNTDAKQATYNVVKAENGTEKILAESKNERLKNFVADKEAINS
jgi:macrodomain Ter protein organizer (MatP/YcbG family)